MLIEARDLTKRYGRKGKSVVTNISFTIDREETLGIFGDSGSGKSTIGQILAGIFPMSSGQLYFEDHPLEYPFRQPARRKIQILFQHPEVAFNPKMKLVDSMREPYQFLSMSYTRTALCAYLEPYGIYDEHLDRYPAQLSGGELQRLALARVMLMEPSFLVLDEPTSMLDVISQAQIISLLRKLQNEQGIGYLFISHDRVLCEQFCTSISYLKQGNLLSSYDGELPK
jgi:ABC-type dipeptide/oligopeptide/nickel transport system ATPase subunit